MDNVDLTIGHSQLQLTHAMLSSSRLDTTKSKIVLVMATLFDLDHHHFSDVAFPVAW
jgi:hypothetical protein